jgi:hypothetical protein
MLVNEYRLEIQFKKVRKVRNIHGRNLRGLWGGVESPPQDPNHPDWQGNMSTILSYVVRQIENQNYGKLTISWDNSILPSYCALKASKYVAVCWPR